MIRGREPVSKTLFILMAVLLMTAGCAAEPSVNTQSVPPPDRESKIPPGQHKMTPELDLLPPILHSNEYEQPVPMPYPINTAGAEDSGFITPDGNNFYVWFTPDPTIPAEGQLDDGVTGIYLSRKIDGVWQTPTRVMLQDTDKQALDGCEFVQGDRMWFCSARTGYAGLHWFTATLTDGKWGGWENADFDQRYEVGELHITADGKELYFHSPRAGGQGQFDIWVSGMENGKWQEPQNLSVVNSPENEGWPSLTQDGNELWFTRFYLGSPALFKSVRIDGEWQEPELVISQFAGESSIDAAGNIYFTHHYYKDGVMLEADIYVAYKK